MGDVVVVGVDGAGFQLLDPWLDGETLPVLSRYIEGRSAPLRTCYPPVTCPAWRCYSTGVNPGKHGVFWWEDVDRKAGTFTVPTAADFAAPDLWDYLGEDGITSAVVNMPTTFPPQELNGWMVSGGGGVDGNAYTYPPNLQDDIEDRFDYRVFIPGTSSNIGDDPDRVEDVLELIDLRFEVADYLRRKYDPDFLTLTIFYSNVFHHFFWDDDVTKRVWQRIDRCLGKFVGEKDNLLVVSDHGSNPIHHEFNVNTWLEQEGYLVTTESVSDQLYRAGLTRDRVTKFVDRFGLKNALKRVLPRSIVTQFPSGDGTVSGHGKAKKIDWAASTAMASGQGPVYVLADDPGERDRVRRAIREKLRTVETPDGRPIARDISLAEDVYSGPYVQDGPDLVIDQADNVQISGRVGTDDVFDSPTDWIAENHRDGVLIARGPDVNDEGSFSRRPSIYDLAPTILHWYGQAVPEAMDGRVLTELFNADAPPGERSVRHEVRDTIPTGALTVEDDQEQMRERLQDLGYLSE